MAAGKELQQLERKLSQQLCKLKTREVDELPQNPCIGESVILDGGVYFYVGNGDWISVIGGVVSGINIVENYSALPDPTTVSGFFYYAMNSQGTSWLPGSLGGTYYSAGLYYSNGIEWKYIAVPYQATQAEVNIGTNTNKFVTPETLKNSTQWDTKHNSIQFKQQGSNLGSSGTVNEVDVIGAGASTSRVGNKVTIDIAGGSTSAVIKSYTAGEVINGGKALYVHTDGLVYHMDITNSAHWYKYLGIAANAAIIGDPVNVVLNGVTNILGSGWLPGVGYYISSTGYLTSTPPTTGLCKQVAVGVNTDEIAINHYSELIII